MDFTIGRIYKFRQRDTSDERHGRLVIVCGVVHRIHTHALVKVQFVDTLETIICTDKCLEERNKNETNNGKNKT